MAKKYSEENLAKSSADNKPVEAIKGIGPTYKEKLHEIGIKTTNDLMNRALKAENRLKLFSETDLSLRDLYEWAGMASLMKVNGIGPKYAKLLSEAGVENIGQLASQNSVLLARSLDRVEGDSEEVNLTLLENTLGSWIDEAKILFEKLGLQRLDFEDITPATLQKLDFQVHDFLNFHSWDSFIRLGNFLQEKSLSKIRRFRRRQIIGEKVLDVETSPEDFELLRKEMDPEILTEHLLEVGESREDIEAFINDLKQGKSDKFQSQDDSDNTFFSEDEIKFPAFIGILGTYSVALGRFNSLPKPKMNLLIPEMDLEKIREFIPEDQDIEITQEDFDSVKDELTMDLGIQTSLKAEMDKWDNEIHDILNGVYGYLAEGQLEELEKTTAVALWQLDGILEESIQTMNRVWAVIYSNPQATTENIRLAVQTSTLLEKQCIAYGVCLYFMAINYNSRLEGSELLKEEISKAKNIDFGSKIPKRDFVALTELLEKSDKFKDTCIETCGSVKHTKEWRGSDKVGFVLQYNEKQINVLLKGCKRKDILPPEGSFVMLSGELTENSGEAIIEVEQFDFDALEKQSWLDHIMKINFNYWYAEGFAIRSNRFLRFPKTAREIIKNYWRA